MFVHHQSSITEAKCYCLVDSFFVAKKYDCQPLNYSLAVTAIQNSECQTTTIAYWQSSAGDVYQPAALQLTGCVEYQRYCTMYRRVWPCLQGSLLLADWLKWVAMEACHWLDHCISYHWCHCKQPNICMSQIFTACCIWANINACHSS